MTIRNPIAPTHELCQYTRGSTRMRQLVELTYWTREGVSERRRMHVATQCPRCQTPARTPLEVALPSLDAATHTPVQCKLCETVYALRDDTRVTFGLELPPPSLRPVRAPSLLDRVVGAWTGLARGWRGAL